MSTTNHADGYHNNNNNKILTFTTISEGNEELMDFEQHSNTSSSVNSYSSNKNKNKSIDEHKKRQQKLDNLKRRSTILDEEIKWSQKINELHKKKDQDQLKAKKIIQKEQAHLRALNLKNKQAALKKKQLEAEQETESEEDLT
ncbi:Protein CBG26281 [Caenorhabditis briggsae]|uniref:Protein CBG26281 n=1 Tax=Caenorhabditis briggsae TaxID=6238 RepID=B6IJI6_CAEBR|nr:Protein CBG26281 [Caenorhabditis briggsae]CAS00066.1 Protein CBG26281 [Caenorhabditis briggsae]